MNKVVKIAILTALVLALIPADALAKDTQFWNLTADTITSLQLSPPGKNEWGRNQADNDRDHTVDHDERLKITDTPAGVYDVKFVDKERKVKHARRRLVECHETVLSVENLAKRHMN